MTTTIKKLANGLKKTDTGIEKIENHQSVLTAMMIELQKSNNQMQKTLTDLSTQMRNMERKPENLAP